MSIDKPRWPVAITGLGCICAAGTSVGACLEYLYRGSRAPAPPLRFTSDHPTGYPVFELSSFAEPPELERTAALGLHAAREALLDAGLEREALSALRVGVCIGTTMGCAICNESFCRDYRNGLHPDLAPADRILFSNPAAAIAREFGFTGPCQSLVNACASGTDAIGVAASWIRGGLCDVVVAGGTDGLGRITYHGFISLMITDDSPCKPFDRERKGLNLGEGAAVLVLESEASLARRSRKARSFVLGYGSASDAFHLTAPGPNGEGLRSAIAEALSCCDIPAASLAFVNAHGTGTADNDRTETAVLADLLPGVPFLSTKGYTGHTLGAAGAIEAVFTVACLERGMIPGSAGFATADADLKGQPVEEASRIEGTVALSESLGFGGNNSVIIVGDRRSLLPSPVPPITPVSPISPITPMAPATMVSGLGVVGGFGCGVNELAEAMKRGVAPLSALEVSTAEGRWQLPALRAETRRLEDFVPARALRRMDRFSRLALLGAYLALEDGGMLGGDLSRLGVVIATGYGATGTTVSFIDSLMAGGDLCASPTHFANSIHSSAAANVSIMLGAKGPCLTVNQLEMSVPSAMVTAKQWLAEKRVDAVLVGGVDELSELAGYLWLRRRGKQRETVPSPLDFDRESAVPGEGAAFLLLTREDGEKGYCAVDSVDVGNHYGASLAVPTERLLLLGADGRQELAARYRAALSPAAQVACYSRLYGTMPAAAGFDLACAALLLRAREISASVDSVEPGSAAPSPGEGIGVVRFAGATEYAVTNLSRLR